MALAFYVVANPEGKVPKSGAVPRSFPLCYLDPLAILPGSLNLPPSLSPRSCSVSVVWGGGDGSVLEVENHWRLEQLMVSDGTRTYCFHNRAVKSKYCELKVYVEDEKESGGCLTIRPQHLAKSCCLYSY